MIDINILVKNDLLFINESFLSSLKDKTSSGIQNIDIKAKSFYNKCKDLFQKNETKIQLAENQLKNSGVDVLKLKSLAKSSAKEAIFKIDKNEFNLFTFVKIVANKFNDCFNHCLPGDNTIGRQISIGVILLGFAIFLNSALIMLFMNWFGPTLGNAFGAIFVAPFTEELGKIISIHQGAGSAYFIIFNITEWSLYVSQVCKLALGLPALATAMALRFVCVYGHYLWSRLHVAYSKTAKSREAGMKLGMLMHSLWNFNASTNLAVIHIPISLYIGYRMVKNREQLNNKSIFKHKK